MRASWRRRLAREAARSAEWAALEQSKFVFIQISREGAESFVSYSPGWGAMGLREITEAIEAELSKEGE
jgi:hypothetical protein